MTQLDTIIKHVDDQMHRTYDPLLKRVEEHHVDLYSESGVKIRQAILETTAKALHKRLDDIERKMDRSYWFSLTTMAGMIVSIFLFFVLR